MRTLAAHDPSSRPRPPAWALALAVSACLAAPAARAADQGKLQGRLFAAESGEPIGFADAVLMPADSTVHPIGMLTNADGTFLLAAPPGRYALRLHAMSYEVKRIEGIVLEKGKVLPMNVSLKSDRIQLKEIVVQARAQQNTETSMLAQRKRAVSVGDAVSAEQVRKSPDKDAAEVLRRVTGLTVSDGKYVFVRGLGERYSSTEVDGVRIATPEQNKRVVPLDLLPANLLENIVVQKTYTADRPGEFGGGDVQVHTRDFPGGRTWSLSISQGYLGGATFDNHLTYAGASSGLFGFGIGDRGIPGAVSNVAGNLPLTSGSPPYGFGKQTLATVARSFNDVWSPVSAPTAPNGTYAATYGNEIQLFGHPLGIIASSSLSRSYDQRSESQRLFAAGGDTSYDYAVDRSTANMQLGGIAGLSYRISPRHTVHLRTLFTESAEDEVRTYQGEDQNRTTSTGSWIQHRDTRLMYVQRHILSGTLEGRDEFASLHGLGLNWKFTRSGARREQPDRREVTYDNGYYYGSDGNLVEYWGLGSPGRREYGDLYDNGWGTTLSGEFPYSLGGTAKGRVSFGYDRQTKQRDNFYRRFDFYTNQNFDPTAPPDSLFAASAFDGTPASGYVSEATLDKDNYHASSSVSAAYLSVDVPVSATVRSTLGVRGEQGMQDVQSFDLFKPDRIVAAGSYGHTDWLPSANLTWAVSRASNVRLAASRTLSRPDLSELSPSPSLEYIGGYQQAGNPNLHRALIDNYDARFEAFPAAAEVVAVGFFYKYLREPIEQTLQGAVPPLLVPRNSDHGSNRGVELELRTALGRYWRRMKGLALNTNASFISSSVFLKPQTTQLGAQEHPLQGQANYAINAGLSYTSRGGRSGAAVLLSSTGKRLHALGYLPLPDVYEEPVTTLDATFDFVPFSNARLKFSARNLLDPRIQQLQGGKEVSGFHYGRSVSVGLTYGG